MTRRTLTEVEVDVVFRDAVLPSDPHDLHALAGLVRALRSAVPEQAPPAPGPELAAVLAGGLPLGPHALAPRTPGRRGSLRRRLGTWFAGLGIGAQIALGAAGAAAAVGAAGTAGALPGSVQDLFDDAFGRQAPVSPDRSQDPGVRPLPEEHLDDQVREDGAEPSGSPQAARDRSPGELRTPTRDTAPPATQGNAPVVVPPGPPQSPTGTTAGGPTGSGPAEDGRSPSGPSEPGGSSPSDGDDGPREDPEDEVSDDAEEPRDSSDDPTDDEVEVPEPEDLEEDPVDEDEPSEDHSDD